MTNLVIDLSDPASARAIVVAALRHELGRWPKEDEVSQVIAAYTRCM